MSRRCHRRLTTRHLVIYFVARPDVGVGAAGIAAEVTDGLAEFREVFIDQFIGQEFVLDAAQAFFSFRPVGSHPAGEAPVSVADTPDIADNHVNRLADAARRGGGLVLRRGCQRQAL